MKVSKYIIGAALLAMSTSVIASEKVTLKAAKSTSSYYQMAVQIGENISKVTNNELSVTIEESQGSVQNVKELRKRKGNYVFTTPPGLIKLAQNKKVMFKNDNPKQYEKVRALFPIPYLTMHMVVRKDLNINSFNDLKGKSILVAKGTFGAREAKKYIKLFGLKDDVKLVNTELSNAVTALKNGRVDGFATSSSYPAPNVIEASASVDIKLVPMNEEEIKLTKRDSIVIPKGTYKGVDQDILTTTLPVGVYTTTNMSEETAYKLTKAFWESKVALEKQNGWWKAVTLSNLNIFKTKLHKGALKYYKEIDANLPSNIK